MKTTNKSRHLKVFFLIFSKSKMTATQTIICTISDLIQTSRLFGIKKNSEMVVENTANVVYNLLFKKYICYSMPSNPSLEMLDTWVKSIQGSKSVVIAACTLFTGSELRAAGKTDRKD